MVAWAVVTCFLPRKHTFHRYVTLVLPLESQVVVWVQISVFSFSWLFKVFSRTLRLKVYVSTLRLQFCVRTLEIIEFEVHGRFTAR